VESTGIDSSCKEVGSSWHPIRNSIPLESSRILTFSLPNLLKYSSGFQWIPLESTGIQLELVGDMKDLQNTATVAAEKRQDELNRQYQKAELARSKDELRLAALAEAAREEAEFTEAAKQEAAKQEAAKGPAEEEAAEEAAEEEAAEEEAVKKWLESMEMASDQSLPAVQTKRAAKMKLFNTSRLIHPAATALTKSKAPKAIHQEDYQTPSESDLTDSDFSASCRAQAKKRQLSSSDEDSSSDEGGESPSTVCHPAKLPKLQLVLSTPTPLPCSAMD